MTASTPLPYGSWPSPITTAMVASAGVGLREPGTNGADVFWVESRPADGGRCVLVRAGVNGDAPADLTPAPFNVRSRVHEYGGGAWAAAGDIVVFSHYADNRLYRTDLAGAPPVPITPEGDLRFADLQLDPGANRLFAVREDHTFPDAEAANTIVSLSLDGPNRDGGTIIISGTDFVSTPRLSPDRTELAWLGWDHPNMPWDGTELWRASIAEDGSLSRIKRVAGGARESVTQPGWDEAGRLVFVSDRTGWWNLYRTGTGPSMIEGGEPEPLTPLNREFGVPQWAFGMSTWAPLADGSIVCAWTSNGVWSLGRIAPDSAADESGPVPYELPFNHFASVRADPSGSAAIALASSATDPMRLIRIDAATGEWTTLAIGAELTVDEHALSIPEPVSWTAPDGATSHGFHYPPANPDAHAPDGERPPLIVESHGGPTGATSTAFDIKIQFWTSRGFAVLDVNYGGSTGYGRAYRERLNGQWGIVDVDDCVSGAAALVERGLADPGRLVIRGGSAGGYTTLAALAFRSVFSAGVSYYGIGDLETMARDTHKFESRYLDGLVGPLPEARATYIERSPIHHVEQLSSAMILFQGLDDKVVPPNQALMMADAVRAKGLPLALLTFPGEGHGFRQAETIRRTLEAELSFFGQLFAFLPADDIPRLTVENLPPPNERR